MCSGDQWKCWKGSYLNLGDVVSNQHLDNCIKMCLTNIWVVGNQNNMEPKHVSIVLNFAFNYDN